MAKMEEMKIYMTLVITGFIIQTIVSIYLIIKLKQNEKKKAKAQKVLHRKPRRNKVVITQPPPTPVNPDANPLNSPTLFDEYFTDELIEGMYQKKLNQNDSTQNI